MLSFSNALNLAMKLLALLFFQHLSVMDPEIKALQVWRLYSVISFSLSHLDWCIRRFLFCLGVFSDNHLFHPMPGLGISTKLCSVGNLNLATAVLQVAWKVISDSFMMVFHFLSLIFIFNDYFYGCKGSIHNLILYSSKSFFGKINSTMCLYPS